jgi:hypothetical protein
MEVSGQLHIPAALPHGKSPWYPLDRRVGGPQSHFGRGGEEKNSQPPPRIEPSTPIVQPVAQRYSDRAIMAVQHLPNFVKIRKVKCELFNSNKQVDIL